MVGECRFESLHSPFPLPPSEVVADIEVVLAMNDSHIEVCHDNRQSVVKLAEDETLNNSTESPKTVYVGEIQSHLAALSACSLVTGLDRATLNQCLRAFQANFNHSM